MVKGSEFITARTSGESIFVPEEFSEEQKMIYDMVYSFMSQEVLPNIEKIDSLEDPGMIPGLLKKAGKLGMLGVAIPEKYGGMDLDYTTNLLFGEASAGGFCFATAIGAQTSLGSLPIVYYGNEEQKEKYLPAIASGEKLAAYCLTETDAGSDANACKTRAKLTEDGKFYILNGQKIWITNGGFADLFVVFAKIDDDEKLSAFLVEKEYEGVSVGPEEKKMGIKGSSTTPVFFDDCRVPAENLLHERGAGFKIALNILNSGRIKIGAGAAGACKIAINKSVDYANDRKQFGKPISEFGAIKHKLAEMAVKCFAVESAVYRVGRHIDDLYAALVEKGSAPAEARLEAVRDFAVECSILKVYGSEVMDYVCDEAIQIHGGMGYSMEVGVERGYRDARVTRIYEGTNEINRLLSVAELMKKAFQTKEIDLVKAMKRATIEAAAGHMFYRSKDEKKLLDNLKRAFLFITGRAAGKMKKDLIDEQEIIMNLADMLAEIFISESVFMRINTLRRKQDYNGDNLAFQEKLMKVQLYEAAKKTRNFGEDALMSFTSGLEQRILLRMLRKLTGTYRINPKTLRREIAERLIEKNEYCF